MLIHCRSCFLNVIDFSSTGNFFMISVSLIFKVSGQLGPGASSLLEHYKIRRFPVKPNTKVVDSIKEAEEA